MYDINKLGKIQGSRKKIEDNILKTILGNDTWIESKEFIWEIIPGKHWEGAGKWDGEQKEAVKYVLSGRLGGSVG